eukprot:6118798-Amphidinium_carterae.1
MFGGRCSEKFRYHGWLLHLLSLWKFRCLAIVQDQFGSCAFIWAKRALEAGKRQLNGTMSRRLVYMVHDHAQNQRTQPKESPDTKMGRHQDICSRIRQNEQVRGKFDSKQQRKLP